MFHILTLLFFIIFLFSNVFCQENLTISDPPHVSHPLHPGLVIVIGILSTMFSLTFLILACAKFCQTDVPIGRHDLLTSRSRFSGIDKKTIENLPFFRFSSLKGSKEGLECAVCLSKFEDSEFLRLLPKCRHSFHMNCIDKWLESHSSCPLCRNKFDLADLMNFTCTNSLRYDQNGPFSEEGLSNLELFVRREQDDSSRSLRFNIGNSFGKFTRSPKDEVLIQYRDERVLDKFKHRIIVSEIVCKSRWSDVNSSDLMFLNSEMLSMASTKRFTKVEDDRVSKDTSGESSKFDWTTLSRSLDVNTEKRSMSEITNVSRFRDKNNTNLESVAKDEKLRSVWLPIANRTVRWFASRERNFL